jgi:hypothetical protein
VSITVNSVRFDFDGYALVLDIELSGGDYLFVWCKYDGAGAKWEGPVSEGRQTIAVNTSPVYFYKGVRLELTKFRVTATGEEVYLTVASVEIPPEQIAGLSDYFEWRKKCLSEAKWKREVSVWTPYGYVLGGFVAIYRALVTDKRKVIVDLTADGTTRYGDIFYVGIGPPNYMKSIIGLTKRSTVEVDLSDDFLWSQLVSNGLAVVLMDVSRAIVSTISIPYNELERAEAEAPITITETAPVTLTPEEKAIITAPEVAPVITAPEVEVKPLVITEAKPEEKKVEIPWALIILGAIALFAIAKR